MFSRKPDTLACGPLVVRPLRVSDEDAWMDLRSRNREWLRPWEATPPPGRPHPTMTFGAFVRRDRKEWRARRAISMGLEYDGELAGRIGVSNIEWGSQCSGTLGYWIDRSLAGQGIVPRAVAMLAKYAFNEGLHRLEIAARPENESSLRVAYKLGFKDEGRRERFLYIDGDWRDHRVFSLRVDHPRTGEYWDCHKHQTD